MPTTQALLDYLRLDPEAPSYAFLSRLLLAYREAVPYETATRLLRYRDIADPDERVRLPEAFWDESMAHGTGGSCSDSSYAFKYLLAQLGFEAAMAISTEGEVVRDDAGRVLGFPREPSHCSFIVTLEGRRYVADPCSGHIIKTPLPVEVTERTEVWGREVRGQELRGQTAEGRAYHYAVEPLGEGYLELHNLGPDADRDRPDPQRGQMYIFRDRSVPDSEFEDYLRYGYREGYASGHFSFLCRRRDAHKTEYRFSSHSGRLWRNRDGPWEQMPLEPEPTHELAEVSGLPLERVREALKYLEAERKKSPEPNGLQT